MKDEQKQILLDISKEELERLLKGEEVQTMYPWLRLKKQF